MGRHELPDTAILKKMALGIVEGKYNSPWEAAGAFAAEAGGNSVSSARKRIHRKFLKNEDALLEEARADLGIAEDEDEEELMYGLNQEDLERLAKYLLSLERNSDRARFVAKFLIWRKERDDLYSKIFDNVRARGKHLTQDDVDFIHVLLAKMERRKMKWLDILWKFTSISSKSDDALSEEESDKPTEKK